jgi:hypothetical protein
MHKYAKYAKTCKIRFHIFNLEMDFCHLALNTILQD